MTDIPNPELHHPADDCRRLIAAQQTLLLSTCSLEHEPDISYAPFVRNEQGHFFIFISTLAKHTKHLIANPRASILFIEPEAGCRNLYARARVVFECSVRHIAPGTPAYENPLRALQDKFGDTVALLRTLPDFHLFELRPEAGHYVAGFGKAYAIDLTDNSLSPFGGGQG
ncbi:MAG: HugZ family pyridoxamine 5'-phosphate oxidase [Gammaproteobacteria bacterium]